MQIAQVVSVDDVLSVHLKQVVVATEALAESIMQQVQDGRDLGELARLLSLHHSKYVRAQTSRNECDLTGCLRTHTQHD
jgi:hypothetical protein